MKKIFILLLVLITLEIPVGVLSRALLFGPEPRIYWQLAQAINMVLGYLIVVVVVILWGGLIWRLVQRKERKGA